jgi:hypothetical protein
MGLIVRVQVGVVVVRMRGCVCARCRAQGTKMWDSLGAC